MADGEGARPSRVTIRTVAADAGVSVAAVSKVLRNAYGVSDALRSKVLASIQRLGYRPNVAARGMRGKSFTAGILVTDFENPFLFDVIAGINATFEAAGYKSLIGVGNGIGPLEVRLIESMIDFRMDGLVLVAPRLANEELANYSRQIPSVVIGHHEPLATTFDSVNSDDRRGAAMVVESFLRSGWQDIAMISLEPLDASATNVSDQREIGYLQAMQSAGLSHLARITHMPLDRTPVVNDTLHTYLTAATRPRAVFCWSDLHAIELRNLAHCLGIQVPDDLAISGYDNSRIAALPLIDLTSIDQSGRLLGVRAAEMLLTRIEGRSDAIHEFIEPRLVSRSSG